MSAQWRVGVAGYALQQLHDGRIDGSDIPGSRQRALALGPGFLWNRGSTTVIGTAYREFASENRPEGINAVFRLLKGFLVCASRQNLAQGARTRRLVGPAFWRSQALLNSEAAIPLVKT